MFARCIQQCLGIPSTAHIKQTTFTIPHEQQALSIMLTADSAKQVFLNYTSQITSLVIGFRHQKGKIPSVDRSTALIHIFSLHTHAYMYTRRKRSASASFFLTLKIRLKFYRLYHLHSAALTSQIQHIKPNPECKICNTHRSGHTDQLKRCLQTLVTTDCYSNGGVFFKSTSILHYYIRSKTRGYEILNNKKISAKVLVATISLVKG